MVILLEEEADAFWCFEHAMRRVVCMSMPLFYIHILYFLYGE